MPVLDLVPPREWPTLGWEVIDWIESRLVHGPGDVSGEPLILDEEWVQFILDVYRLYPKRHPRAGRRVVGYALASMPKGRAKSEIAGALVCAELLGPVRFSHWDGPTPVGKPVKDPYIRILATEEGQTGNTYDNVIVMLRHFEEHFPDEAEGLDIGTTRIHLGRGGVHGKVVPATAGSVSKDGGKETFAVADEIHLYVLPELIYMHELVQQNSQKRKIAQPWMLATTTMYEPGQGSVGEVRFKAALKELELEAHGKRRSRAFCMHHRQGDITAEEWDDDEAQIRSLTEAFGPAAEWQDFEQKLENDIRAPGKTMAKAMRFWHNIEWKGDSKAVDPSKLAELADPTRNPTGGEEVLLAFDGSDRGEHADDTVLVGWTVDATPHLFFIHRQRRPSTAGREYKVDRRTVRREVTAARKKYKVRRLAGDPPGWQIELEAWAEEFGADANGDPIVVEFITNRPSDMGPAIDRMLEAIDNKAFTYDGSPELTEYFTNAVLGETGGRAKYPALGKPTIDEKIDGLVAATFGLDVLADIPVAKEKVAPFVMVD
jgi:phage terminase large subunit-like protein